MTAGPPRPERPTADGSTGGDGQPSPPGSGPATPPPEPQLAAIPTPEPPSPAIPTPEPQLPAAPVPDPHDPHPPTAPVTGPATDGDSWQTALGALTRMLPPEDSGRTARGDVDRLARNDAQRQARAAAERDNSRAGRPDSERLPRLRGAARSARTPQRPQRVRVTSSRMTATARAPLRTVSREIDEQTGIGEVYLRSLLRAQLRLGLSVIAVLVLCLGTLPLVFAIVPPLGTVRLATVPLPWLLVGVSVYPLLLGVAWWHVVAAERAERDFAAIVESD